jgi:hypothetical protein
MNRWEPGAMYGAAGDQTMSDFLNDMMDQAAALVGDISIIKRQLRPGEKMTGEQLAKLIHRAAQIVVMLQAVEID